jgi:hypothetical protein
MRIPLTQGQFAIVDAEDYEKLAGYKWCAVKTRRIWYAERSAQLTVGKHRQYHISMHRQIMNKPKGLFVDHINHNGLDNRKANLRIVTQKQNCWNQRKHRGNFSSQYRGVLFNNRGGRWQSAITCEGRKMFIGYFDDEKSAAKAYDDRAREMYGEFAAPNFPEKI